MFTVEVKVGGLIEARIKSLADVDEALAYSAALGRAVRAAGDKRMVLCADHRPVSIYSQPVADKLAELFARMNAQLERVAILASRSNATLSMQLGRIVREANNPSRKIFFDGAEAETFLAEALSEAERARLALFLSG